MVAGPTFGKQAPTPGTTGLGSPVTLQWSALPEEGYYVCWDTTDNDTCDTTWWPNAAATTRAVSGLAVGTYYWQVKTIGGLEADSGTWWSFTVTVPFVPADHWKAEYFGNATLSGTPVATVDEGTGFVDHSWGTGGPAGLADHFSARFTRTVPLAAGTYRFTVTTDDGSQLWVDEQLQVNAWGADGLTTHTVDLNLAAGDHTLRFQYVEHTGGATAQLTWALRTPVVLASGESLGENQTRVSLDGLYRLQYQGDGNLVVVRVADESSAWSSQTSNTSVGATVMQGDGNLVVYNGDWTAVWASGTNGSNGARLEIANHTMAIVAPDNTTLWSVSLAAEPARPNACGRRHDGHAAGGLEWACGSRGRCPARRHRADRSGGEGREAAVGCCSSRKPPGASRWQAARRLRARLSATALLLAAMLLVPATALAQIPTQQVEYYHTDALGSVRAVTKQVNGTWQVMARHDFMPFGEEVAPPTPPQDKRLFTGKERDSETGLDYFEARYLRATVARFTTVDPIQVTPARTVDPQRLNLYAYTRNNPLRFNDPSGMDVELGNCARSTAKTCYEQLVSGLREEDRDHVSLLTGDGSNGYKKGHFYVLVERGYKSTSGNFARLQQAANDRSATVLIDVLRGSDKFDLIVTTAYKGDTPIRTRTTSTSDDNGGFTGYTFFPVGSAVGPYSGGPFTHVVINADRSADPSGSMHHELVHVVLGDFGRLALRAGHGDPVVDSTTTAAETEAIQNRRRRQ